MPLLRVVARCRIWLATGASVEAAQATLRGTLLSLLLRWSRIATAEVSAVVERRLLEQVGSDAAFGPTKPPSRTASCPVVPANPALVASRLAATSRAEPVASPAVG